jgi:hypothetical protein
MKRKSTWLLLAFLGIVIIAFAYSPNVARVPMDRYCEFFKEVVFRTPGGTDSPSLIFLDGSGEYVEIKKLNSGNLTVTTSDSLQLITGGIVTPKINGHDEIRIEEFNYYDLDIASSQSLEAWGIDPSANVGGILKYHKTPLGGSLIGLTVYIDDTISAGNMTVDITFDGSPSGFQAVLNSGIQSVATMNANTEYPIDAGLVGVQVSTSVDWAAGRTPNGMIGVLWSY